MSDVISFRADASTADEIAREMEEDPDDPSRSEVTKRLVHEAVHARHTPLWVRVGMSDRRAAQVEALRKEGESEADLARELFGEALEARDEDALDAIGASDELREAVEERREDGESLDGAVERLLREGVESVRHDPGKARLQLIAVILAYTLVVVALTVVAGWQTVGVATVLASVGVLVYTRFRPLGALSTWG